MSMEELWKAIIGGAQQQPAEGTGADTLSDLLGSILGGGAAQGGAQAESGGISLPDLIGSILGGGAQQGIPGAGAQRRGAVSPTPQGGGGIADILGSILGGSAGMGANSFLAPIINALAEQLGLPPATAQAVVGFVLTKLLPGLLGGAGAAAPSATPRRRTRAAQPQVEGLDLDSLLEQMGSEEGLDPDYWRSSGIADELSEQTGLDSDTAVQSLQQVFGMIGTQLGSPRAQRPSQKKPGGLDHLLDTWQD